MLLLFFDKTDTFDFRAICMSKKAVEIISEEEVECIDFMHCFLDFIRQTF